ncbi:MAG: type I polyketide synthase, partial [Micromonosporaceae bacterium]
MTKHTPTGETSTLEPIAIIGMACRVPGAADIEEFWKNLRDGVESVRFFSAEEAVANGANPRRVADPQYVLAAPVLDGIEDFDAGLFGLTRREAEILDPQHRVFLECAVAALDHAGYDPARYSGEIGVYGGVGSGDYQWYNLLNDKALIAAVGRMAIALSNNRDYAPTFLSYKLNLRGPSVAVSTACSTGLVAVHLAAEAVRNGECEMALAGAASIETGQLRGYLYQEGGILSPDGHCRAFDADARGTLWGSGGGIVVLKRLSDALADGDTVHAILLGSAVNNDGCDKVGFSAPSVSGQSAVIAQALSVAGVEPGDIDYVEAHGTGTQVGDPIEVQALAAVYGRDHLPAGSCRLGTVKPNIGHLAAAAGVVGLIKTVLALEHETLPPTVHFRRPNPQINFDATPFRVVSAAEPWPRDAKPRRAGVSSFGMGGTNVHAIVAEAPRIAGSPPTGDPQVVLVSAATPSALDTMTDRLVEHVRAHPHLALDDIAYTLQLGRRSFPHRRAVVGGDVADVAGVLAGSAPRRLLTGHAAAVPETVFLFPGQGAQRVGMSAELYRCDQVIRDHIEAGLDLLQGLVEVDLRSVLFAAGDDAAAAAELRRTRSTQPALFLVEYALAHRWLSWGVRPAAMLGHSLGEYVAACLAGVFSFTDALRLVAVRARLMQSRPPGAMLAVQLDAESLQLPGTGLDLAAVNAPMTCVVSGPIEAVDAYEKLMADEGIPVKRLRTSHAFHSAMMRPVGDAFAAEVGRTDLHAPQLPVVSNLTGDWLRADEATSPEYWVKHMLSPVLFGPGLQTLLDETPRVLLEVGPGQTLTGLARMQPRAHVPEPVASMPTPASDEHAAMLTAAGRLWTLGVPVDWAATHPTARRRMPLPGQPFERQRHWVE